jgi:D-methionine transport system ATP-binding protein
MISLEQVCLTNPITDQYLLKDISLEIHRGDRLAVIGSSGSGKTTLFRLLNGLASPTSGSLRFQGQNYLQIAPVVLRRQIVLVTQEVRLLEMTVRETLAYPLVLQKLPPAKIQTTLDYWIEKFHLPHEWLGRTEQQLSLGQRQWVGICRALILQPPVLLLDEPTSALDRGRTDDLLQILVELNQQQQTTILMANHQLDVVQQFATSLVYLQQGELTPTEHFLETNSKTNSGINWDAIASALQGNLAYNLPIQQQQLTSEWEVENSS